MAVTFVCPKGDQSDDAEYCSVCGMRMQVAPGAADPSVERCPSCGVQRQPGARYCETCRYDFRVQSNAPGTAGSGLVDSARPSSPVVAAASGPTSPTTSVQEVLDTDVPAGAGAVAGLPSVPPGVVAHYWEAIVTVDPTLDVEPDPDAPCPLDTPERTFPLDLAENLVGRRSAARGILPSIALNDPGVSHRHLMVYRNPDATLMVSDLDSTNGSFLNGSTERLEPGVKTPVADGDRIELGRWTRLTFHCRN